MGLEANTKMKQNLDHEHPSHQPIFWYGSHGDWDLESLYH